MNYLRAKMKGIKSRVRVTCFTLIELLVVVAVIGVLVGLLLPAYNMVRAKGKVTKAKSEMNAIITAIKAYESTYGVLPVLWASPTSPLSDNQYDGLMNVLTYVNVTGGSPDPANKLSNTRGVNFLDSPTGYSDTIVDASDPRDNKGTYRDPWGIRYKILMDTDYDGIVADPDTGDLNGSVFVYSYGPNNTNDKGNSAGDEDDITTWD